MQLQTLYFVKTWLKILQYAILLNFCQVIPHFTRNRQTLNLTIMVTIIFKMFVMFVPCPTVNIYLKISSQSMHNFSSCFANKQKNTYATKNITSLMDVKIVL